MDRWGTLVSLVCPQAGEAAVFHTLGLTPDQVRKYAAEPPPETPPEQEAEVWRRLGVTPEKVAKFNPKESK